MGHTVIDIQKVNCRAGLLDFSKKSDDGLLIKTYATERYTQGDEYDKI
jgi:hypothetical protein